MPHRSNAESRGDQQLTDNELAHLAVQFVKQYGVQPHLVKCVICGDTFHAESMLVTRNNEIWCAWCVAATK